MLKKIAIELHDITDDGSVPSGKFIHLWAWVENGWALHPMIHGARSDDPKIEPKYWTVTHLPTGCVLSHWLFAVPRGAAKRAFARVIGLSDNGKFLGEMSPTELLSVSPATKKRCLEALSGVPWLGDDVDFGHDVYAQAERNAP